MQDVITSPCTASFDVGGQLALEASFPGPRHVRTKDLCEHGVAQSHLRTVAVTCQNDQPPVLEILQWRVGQYRVQVGLGQHLCYGQEFEGLHRTLLETSDPTSDDVGQSRRTRVRAVQFPDPGVLREALVDQRRADHFTDVERIALRSAEESLSGRHRNRRAEYLLQQSVQVLGCERVHIDDLEVSRAPQRIDGVGQGVVGANGREQSAHACAAQLLHQGGRT